MKFSEAIRLGAMLRPQAFGIMFKHGGSCALGAALEAVGVQYREGHPYFSPNDVPFTVPHVKVFCPMDNCGLYGMLPMHCMVTHLNDDHLWTRERIADWVETIESQDETVTVDAAEAHVTV